MIYEKLGVKFDTYPGLMAKAKKDPKVLEEQFDLIVLDELHRTGAENWGKYLDTLLENQKEETKVLGITATPIRDVDGKDMSAITAEKLGYTKEDIDAGKHIAYNLDLIEAIQLGLVVNPKKVTCEYTLIEDGSMERLKEKIEAIEDETEKAKEMEKFNKLRSQILEKAEGIPEILQRCIKPGQRFIAFLPATAMITEEDRKIGEAKIKEFEEKITKYFEDSEIVPEFYSMLGSYGAKKNEQQLKGFETSTSQNTKFMLVINKAKEGLHIANLNGMIWFRALDSNSNILYHQQLGRVIHPEDKDNPTKDADRPIVIDLANNTFRINMDKKVNTYTKRSDLDLLTTIVDWVQKHNGGNLPDVESTSKQEKRYAATLYRIQNKYLKYFDEETMEEEEEKDQKEIRAVIEKGYEIDLWDTVFPHPMTEEEINKILNVDAFKVTGILEDFVELEDEVDSIENASSFDKNIELLKGLLEAKGEYYGLTADQVRKAQRQFKEKGYIHQNLILKLEGQNQTIQIGHWLDNQRQMLNRYRELIAQNNIDEIKDEEEKRRIKGVLKLGVRFTNNAAEIWNNNLELLEGLLAATGDFYGLTKEKVEKVQKQFKERGYIPKNLILKLKWQNKTIQIGRWVKAQRSGLLNKYRNLILQNKIDEISDETEKNRVKRLLKIGIMCIDDRITEWNKNLELLKGLLETEDEYYGLTTEQLKKAQRQFKERGYIPITIILKIEVQDEPVQIGVWLSDQRKRLNKYRELILQNKIDEISNKREGDRVRKLVDLGVSWTDEKGITWEEKFDLLKGLLEAKGEYYGLTKAEVRKAQIQFEEKGYINKRLNLLIKGENIAIGEWLNKQRKGLKQYGHMPQSNIKDAKERKKIEALLDLGVSYLEEKQNKEDKTLKEIWNENLELLKGLLEATGEYYGLTEEKVRDVQRKFEEKGYINCRLILIINGQRNSIGKWLDSQRQMLNRYREEIANNKTNEINNKEDRTRVETLVTLGVSCTEEKGEKLKEVKRKRDQAEEQNAEAKKLEADVEKELKKRGQGYGEQQ